MTFNWKKKSRLSRLVADHLQSPKHGGSLVVETGFPTSLIDLYVRNRSRFRKTSKRSEKNRSGSSCELSVTSDVKEAEVEEVLEEEVVFSDFDDVIVANGTRKKRSQKNESDGSLDGERVEEVLEVMEEVVGDVDDVEIVKCGGDGVEKGAEMRKLSPVYVVLLIVVLILGCKRFKVGITLSAFVLFVLEMVGRPVLRRGSLSRALSGFDGSEKNVESLKRNIIRNGVVVVVSSDVSSEIEEHVELKREVRLRDVLDEVQSEGVMETRRKSSRRDVMKTRMKKLVPKKLRKASVSTKDEVSSCTFYDVKPLAVSSECETKDESLSVIKEEQDEIVELEGREEGRERNSGYLVLFLIVLCGLIGGKVLALVLALSWCLMQKMSRWQNVKFSVS